MKYLSVCSGIEAATSAWHPLGWEAVGFSEIEPFPSAVLQHHYPEVTNFGDMTKYKEWNLDPAGVDLLVGGTPCQSFSVAGLRKGLDDPRGNLALVYCGMLDHFRPNWFVWENVPGVLSSNGGRDFGAFLGAVGELGYGFSYRVLDAQYFGVAQRRRRVFVVGHLGGWERSAAVLFERESLRRDTAPSREARKETAAAARAGLVGGFDYENNAHGATDPTGPLLKGSPTGGGRPLPAIVTAARMVAFGEYVNDDTASAMKARDYKDATDLIAFHPTQDPIHSTDGSTHAMGCGSPKGQATVAISHGMSVRRLTPTECERLQGFPDGHTDIMWKNKPANDGARYKALGNSMAVPVMNWIGKRIQLVDNL